VTIADSETNQNEKLRAADWLVSFKADRLWTSEELDLPKCGALNVHLAPPWHRGVGGYERAIIENWSHYGVTVHHMTAAIDAGPILSVDQFPIPPQIDATGLAGLAACRGLLALSEIFTTSLCVAVPQSQWEWTGPLYTRAYLTNLLDAYPTVRRLSTSKDPSWNDRRSIIRSLHS
jgi:methionyl-tRNA formyltransferase